MHCYPMMYLEKWKCCGNCSKCLTKEEENNLYDKMIDANCGHCKNWISDPEDPLNVAYADSDAESEIGYCIISGITDLYCDSKCNIPICRVSEGGYEM